MPACEIVIVGGGIGGGALATALARDGVDVVVLEASEQYRDRVRGESMLPWGVKEARELGAEQVLLEAGAHVAPAWVQYDAGIPTETVEANPIPVGMILPDISGSLNLRHPDACQALSDAAVAAGARVVRGVREVSISPGERPVVRFGTSQDGASELTARLVVGADGRNSSVRRQARIPLQRQPEAHMIAGLLLDGVGGLPDDRDFLASEADLFMAAFQQGSGRLRLYLCPGLTQRHRFSGPSGVDEFLQSSAFACLPFGEELARAQPAGPIATYPADDSWCEQPFVEGIVLIGDAAGWNNPIIGQGLSIAMRDARMVRETIRDGDYSNSVFAEYASERLERLRRVRASATVMGAAFGEDGCDRAARRARFFELQQSDPSMMPLLISTFAGPENGPPDAFDGHLLAAIRGQTTPTPAS